MLSAERCAVFRKNTCERKVVRHVPDQIGEVGATDFSVVNAALQSDGADVPVTVTSFALDVTMEPDKLTAPGPSV